MWCDVARSRHRAARDGAAPCRADPHGAAPPRDRRRRAAAAWGALLLAALAGCAPTAVRAPVAASPAPGPAAPAAGAPVALALIGDMPYGPVEEWGMDRLIEDLHADPQLQAVLHLGDIKAGWERCDDVLLQRRHAQIQRIRLPVVYTPGDNEWTDCHRPSNGAHDPLERLAFLRRLFFAQPGSSAGGRPMPLRSQATAPGHAAHAAHVEHSLFVRAGVVIAVLHVVGSHNGLEPWSGIDPADSTQQPRADRLAEVRAREAAALAWIDQAFDEAQASQAPGVLLAWQANPAFERKADDPQRAGYQPLLARIKERAQAFGRPVLLVHGDGHEWILDAPFMRWSEPQPWVTRFLRLQTPGSPRLHWVRLVIDPATSGVFHIEPRWVAGNR